MEKPKARTKEIIIQAVEDEVFIYDLKSERCYGLNPSLTKIYYACDGKRTFDEIVEIAQQPPELIIFGLEELAKNNLLESEFQLTQRRLSRRDVIKKIGFA